MTERLLIPFVAGLMLIHINATARDSVLLESRFLGDGWFEYTLVLTDDRYYAYVDDVGLELAFPAFNNWWETPTNWIEAVRGSTTGDFVRWDHNPDVRETVPYRVSFRIQSQLVNFKLSRATVARRLNFQPWVSPPFGGGDVVAVGTVNCLAPCLPEEADGSISPHAESFSGFPEIEIKSFVISSGRPVGLRLDAMKGLSERARQGHTPGENEPQPQTHS